MPGNHLQRPQTAIPASTIMAVSSEGIFGCSESPQAAHAVAARIFRKITDRRRAVAYADRPTARPVAPWAAARARQRPCRRTAHQRDEFASFHSIELHPIPHKPGPGTAGYRIDDDQSAGVRMILHTECRAAPKLRPGLSPVLLNQQTLRSMFWTPLVCQNRTHAPQQRQLRSVTFRKRGHGVRSVLAVPTSKGKRERISDSRC